MVAVPHKKRASVIRIAGIAAAVSALLMLVCINLDTAGQWFVQQDNLLEGMYCYQLMIAADSMLGLRDWRLSNAWTNLSRCYAKLGRNADAVFAGRQARDLMCSLTGEDSINVCLLDAQLAESLANNGQYAEAEHLLKADLSQLPAMNRQVPLAKAYVLRLLTDAYMDERKFDLAEQSAEELVPIDDQLQKDLNVNTFGPREKLVDIYCQTGRLDLARRLAIDTVRLSETLNNPLSQAAAHDSLARVHLHAAEKEEARREFDRALELLAKGYGPNDQHVSYWRGKYQTMMKEKD